MVQFLHFFRYTLLSDSNKWLINDSRILKSPKSAQLCANIFLCFYTKNYFELKNQICRSDLSISSNIAEGFERGSDREFTQIFNICQRLLWGVKITNIYRYQN